jgi:hypothetical protein
MPVSIELEKLLAEITELEKEGKQKASEATLEINLKQKKEKYQKAFLLHKEQEKYEALKERANLINEATAEAQLKKPEEIVTQESSAQDKLDEENEQKRLEKLKASYKGKSSKASSSMLYRTLTRQSIDAMDFRQQAIKQKSIAQAIPGDVQVAGKYPEQHLFLDYKSGKNSRIVTAKEDVLITRHALIITRAIANGGTEINFKFHADTPILKQFEIEGIATGDRFDVHDSRPGDIADFHADEDLFQGQSFAPSPQQVKDMYRIAYDVQSGLVVDYGGTLLNKDNIQEHPVYRYMFESPDPTVTQTATEDNTASTPLSNPAAAGDDVSPNPIPVSVDTKVSNPTPLNTKPVAPEPSKPVPLDTNVANPTLNAKPAAPEPSMSVPVDNKANSPTPLSTQPVESKAIQPASVDNKANNSPTPLSTKPVPQTPKPVVDKVNSLSAAPKPLVDSVSTPTVTPVVHEVASHSPGPAASKVVADSRITNGISADNAPAVKSSGPKIDPPSNGPAV